MLKLPLSGRLDRGAARGAALLVLLLWPAVAAARTSTVQVEATAVPSAGNVGTLAEALREARAVLERGEAGTDALNKAAATLLAAADIDGLRAVLTGKLDRSALAALNALAAPGASGNARLLPELLELAARSSPDVKSAALAQLERLAADETEPDVVSRLVSLLTDPALDSARRDVVIRVLGASRRLEVVDPLIDALDGPQADRVREALTNLTGHKFDGASRAADWRAWWRENSKYALVDLLYREIVARDQKYDVDMAAKDTKIIKVRIETMSTQIDRLLVGLLDEYPSVRLEAARVLEHHPSKDQAATCVPVILRRLGFAVQPDPPAGLDVGNGGKGGALAPGGASASAAAVPVPLPAAGDPPVATEANPEVCAAMVRTLGVLGRTREDVRDALLAELGSQWPAVSAEAAAGLELLRDQPGIVAPLLDYLARVDGEDNAVDVLTAVAQNRPSGSVIQRLQPLLDARLQTPRVRSAAVFALMACDNLGLALETLEHLFSDTTRDVRFAMAASLGDRVRQLPKEAPERQAIVGMLTTLVEDPDTSVRLEAAKALGKSGALTAVTVLDKRSTAEVDASVLAQIVESLGTLQLQDSVPIIGRIVTAQRGEGRAALEAKANLALEHIGDGRPVADWLAMGESLDKAGAPSLAAWVFGEIVTRFESQPEDKDAVGRARGALAQSLVASGQFDRAHVLLESLEREKANWPTPADRLDLLARVAVAQGKWSEAADFYVRRLELLPEGESQRTATLKACVNALESAHRNAEALPYLRTLVNQDAANNVLLFELVQLEETLGQKREAYADLLRLDRRIPPDDVQMRASVDAAMARVTAALGALPPEAAAPPVGAGQPVAPGAAGATPAHDDKAGGKSPAVVPNPAAPAPEPAPAPGAGNGPHASSR